MKHVKYDSFNKRMSVRRKCPFKRVPCHTIDCKFHLALLLLDHFRYN